MFKKKVDVDVISDVLKAVIEAQPHSTFAQSLYQQYQERGGLSKKQLEGLYAKAQKIDSIPTGKLATLEAVILKRPTRYKSTPPPNKPLYEKDEHTGKMIDFILGKSPLHKRVIFFKNKYDNNEPFQPAETLELERFYKLFVEKFGN